MASNSSNSSASDSRDRDGRWYFTAEQLANSPSRRQGIDADQELSFRQLTAYLIQEMGQRLQVSQLCINTAIVYMHRFYAFHSFTHFHRNGIAAASLFLAAKVEEQPRKLEHVIKVSHMCLSTDSPHPSTEAYGEQAQDLVFNENVLLQTLGFDVAIDHPHTHVVKTCHLVKACKDLAQTSYFLASNSLHLTSMCLQYRPTVVACFCIYLACKWSRWEIPQSTEGKHWFHYVDKGVTMDLLKQLTDEFIAIYEKSPARLKSKLNSIKALAQGARIESTNGSSSQMPQMEPARRPESYSSHHRSHHSSSHAGVSHHHHSKLPPTGEATEHKPASSHKQPYPPTSSTHSTRPRPDRSQNACESQYTAPPHGASKQLPIPCSSRPSSTGRLPPHGTIAAGSTGSAQQRIPHAHDINYHKSRSSLPAQVNPPMTSHKIPPKSSDPARNLLKDTAGRAIDPNKIHVKHSSTMFPPHNPPSNAVVDAPRNMMQQQQQQQQPSSGSIAQQRPYVPPASFNQVAPNRSGNNSNSNSSSIKYEQSVQQQQPHMHLNQKQPIESSFSTTNSRQIDEGIKLAEQMEICSPPKYSSYQQPLPTTLLSQQQQQQQTHQPHHQTKPLSIFSPEWNDKSAPLPTSSVSSISSSNGSIKPLGVYIKPSKDSPKKMEKERKSETPKKERIRAEQVSDSSKIITGEKKFLAPPISVSKKSEMTAISGQCLPQVILQDVKVKPDNALNYSGVKRLATTDSVSKLQDEEILREAKVRKIELQSSPKYEQKSSLLPLLDQQMAMDSRLVKSFPATVNGIETNPDLVSCLLKESLTDSKFNATALIKTEPKEEPEDLSVPDHLVAAKMPIQSILPVDVPIKQEIVSPIDDHLKSKSEKKKKKDKHKHKEKDKSKDKEERKKHKKDKDKHRDKDKERLSSGAESVEQNPVKIKISKDKLNLPILEAPNPQTSGFKIKIPKDRIKRELFQPEENCNPFPPPSSLKIKISKDKIENYSQPSAQDAAGAAIYSTSTVSHSHHSSSSKKKDKDRDRDKEKRRSANEYNKQNGSSMAGSSGFSTSSSLKNLSSSSGKDLM